jgi:DNA-binding transcriptional MocR family regulator
MEHPRGRDVLLVQLKLNTLSTVADGERSFRFKLLLGEDGDSESVIRTKAFAGGVLALPGTVFFPNGERTAYVRASFSLLDEELVNEALRRLRVVLLTERGLAEGINS